MPAVISCIMPVYNAAPYLPAALESVLSQSFAYFELLLIDDGSTDESPHLCDEAALHDSRVRVIHQANAGVAAARNKGLALAEGRYLCFVDSDDVLLPGAFAAIVRAMDGGRLDLVSFNFVFCTPTSRTPAQYTAFSAPTKAEFWPHFMEYYRANQFFSLCNKAYRTAFVRQHGLTFETALRTGEDIAFNFSAFSLAGAMAHLNDCLYEYWHHEATLTRAATLDNMAVCRRVLEGVRAFLTHNGQADLYLRLEEAQLPWDASNFYTLLLDSSKPYTLAQRREGLAQLFGNEPWHAALLRALARPENAYQRYLAFAARRKSVFFATLPLRLKGCK